MSINFQSFIESENLCFTPLDHFLITAECLIKHFNCVRDWLINEWITSNWFLMINFNCKYCNGKVTFRNIVFHRWKVFNFGATVEGAKIWKSSQNFLLKLECFNGKIWILMKIIEKQSIGAWKYSRISN